MGIFLLFMRKYTNDRLLALLKKKTGMFSLARECFVAESNFRGLNGNPMEKSSKTKTIKTPLDCTIA